MDINAWTAGIASLGLYTAAYVAEVLRSGVFSVGKGQIEASLSLGFTYAATLRRIVLPQAFRTVISPLGSLTIAMIKNSAIVGVSLLALPDLLKQARIVAVAHVRDQRGVLLGRGRLPDPHRAGDAGHPRPRAPVRDPPMSYLFDPDNWEWLWTGNNARFILEGFLINLEIALVSMVFALIFGLMLALLRLSRLRPVSIVAGRVDRRVPQPAADLPDPLLRARPARARGRTRGRTSCPSGRRRRSSPGSCSAR